MEGSDDIICPKFSISRGGKTLFHDSKLSLVYGRRYGLIGEPAPAARTRTSGARDSSRKLACYRVAAAASRPKRLR